MKRGKKARGIYSVLVACSSQRWHTSDKLLPAQGTGSTRSIRLMPAALWRVDSSRSFSWKDFLLENYLYSSHRLSK